MKIGTLGHLIFKLVTWKTKQRNSLPLLLSVRGYILQLHRHLLYDLIEKHQPHAHEQPLQLEKKALKTHDLLRTRIRKTKKQNHRQHGPISRETPWPLISIETPWLLMELGVQTQNASLIYAAEWRKRRPYQKVSLAIFRTLLTKEKMSVIPLLQLADFWGRPIQASLWFQGSHLACQLLRKLLHLSQCYSSYALRTQIHRSC